MTDQDASGSSAADQRRDLGRLIAELREWHLFRIAAAYLVAAWLVIQVVATVGPAFDLPSWVLRSVVLAVIVGFLVTMGVLLFRPRHGQRHHAPVYLSSRARLIAAGGVLLIAAAAGVYAVRQFSAAPPVALAVLPFADLSPARDKVYFAEGVGEEILSTLAAEEGIKVLGRSSARQIERNPNPSDIRASLGVTHLLEGSARTSGDQLRVNVRLIDTSDGSQMWEEEYSGQLADVFQVQDQIAATVVKRLRGTLFGQSVRSAKATATGAYEAYLAARSLMRTRTEQTLTQALQLARKVIEADANYAPGHAIYAELLFLLSDEPNSYGSIPTERARTMAMPHARKAIALAPDKSEGYAALGLILPRDRAVEPLKKAIALDPGRTELRIWLGVALTATGRHDEAYEQYREAAETEPLWPVAINRWTQALSASGNTDEALRVIRRFRERGGAEAQALRFLATVHRAMGDLSGAAAADRAAFSKDRTTPYVQEWLQREYKLMGLTELAAAAWPQATLYSRLFHTGDYQALSKRAIADGAKAWADVDVDYALFVLAAQGQWPAIARLYALRPASSGDLCLVDPQSIPIVVMALRTAGQLQEAERLFACGARRLDLEMNMRFASPNAEPGRLEYRKASLHAVAGRRDAIIWLGRAVDRGWLGQYASSNLDDWAQFQSLRTDPQYRAIQGRISATVARERAETLRSLAG